MDVIIQARMSSSRLPGKVLIKLKDKPVLWYVYNRLKKSKLAARVYIATTTDPTDDELYNYCINNNIPVFRGNLNDVLDRYYQLAKKEKMKDIIRITADCPLIDWEVLDKMIVYYQSKKKNIDYLTNTNPPTYPDGLDIEIFSFKSLDSAWKYGKLQSEREHVTPYINKHPEIFKLDNFRNDEDLSSMRWTLDEPADLEFIKKVYEYFNYDLNIKLADVLNLLKQDKKLLDINSVITRNEGYAKSLKQDKIIK